MLDTILLINAQPSLDSSYYISIILSIIAIGLTVFNSYILPPLKRPSLNLSWENNGECLREFVPLQQYESRSMWIRLVVTNKKKKLFLTKASGCYLKLEKIVGPKGEIPFFNPILLPWVSFGDTNHDLAPGEKNLVDLLVKFERMDLPISLSEHYIIQNAILPGTRPENISTSLQKKLEEYLSEGEYIFEVGLYGDNFKPTHYKIEVLSGKSWNEISFK